LPLGMSWLRLTKNPDHHTKKDKPFSQKMHLKIPLSRRVRNCETLDPAAEFQIFTSLWSRYHQWLPETELIQVSAFSKFIF
jgi:hypothetical protein